MFFVKGCEYIDLVGDGYCNDETNNLHCNFDGGDCCYSCVITKFCTHCLCLAEEFGKDVNNPLLGDGYCHDLNDNVNCNFDHGDCCLSNLNTSYCSECSCSVNGIITSPGFPQKYDIYLDLIWLVQLPLGQYIEIEFLNFVVRYCYDCG